MPDEFPTRYDPKGETEIYKQWEESGAFAPQGDGPPFSVVLPPPNVTGTLHVGHAVMLAIEDMMVRYHRMKGDRTVWIPGLDHAAIATQNVVEKKLKKENVKGRGTRHELGREAFLEEVGKFVEQSKARIIEQTKAMGASLDWSRLAYTLDAERSNAVRTMFVRMYEAGILYRGNRIVHWCPRCKSTLADDEVNYKEEMTTLLTFRYDEQWPEDLAISTTRPETKFGDTGVALHPDDPRAVKYSGKSFIAKFAGGVELSIRVITDPRVDRTFGTGVVGVTPAHSFMDAEFAGANNLPSRIVITEDGTMDASLGQPYGGLKVKEAREKIIAELRERGLVRKEEPLTHNLSVCYRCETPVEPLPKLQWFVDVNKKFRKGKSLKDFAIAAVGDGAEQVKIIPERFTKEYFHWMENLRDWCISRQIWFGHRLPVWYRGEEVFVGVEAPQGGGWEQDPDTLDTWFSAGMWTFSTLGWPEETKDLRVFHPTSVLETGYDILFFWIARMIVMTEFTLDTIPFKTVYLHGLVRDSKGRKMSKSLGNVIDPLMMSEKYGADAVRLALFIGTSAGQDTKLDEQKIAGYAKFVTKLWNIARYVSTKPMANSRQLGEDRREFEGDAIGYRLSADGHGIADAWILSKREQLVRDVTAAYEAFEFSKAAQLAYDFAWHEFADWYIEATKAASTEELKKKNKSSEEQGRILSETLEVILKLLHPAMPFVTEALWARLGYEGLIAAPWPTAGASRADTNGQAFEYARDLATAIRQARSEDKIEPKTLIAVTLVPKDAHARAWARHGDVQAFVKHFGRVAELHVAIEHNGAPRTTVRSTNIHVVVPRAS